MWGAGHAEERKYLRVFINRLRKRIEASPREPKFLLTEPFVGYRPQTPRLVTPFPSTFVYTIRTCRLCGPDPQEITFVSVNDERIHDGSFVHRRNGLFVVQTGRQDGKRPSGSVLRILTKENDFNGVTMKNLAIYAGLFAVLASPFAALAAPAAQSSMKADSDSVTITGRVSCSRFGGGSVTARKGMSVAQTIQFCAHFMGGQYTIVSGKQIFLLTGDEKVLAKMSGQTVTVAGRLNTNEAERPSYALMGTVEATSVSPAKN